MLIVRRTILILGAVVIFAMLVYPPWLYSSGSYRAGEFASSHGEYHAGYHFLFLPPEQSRVNIQLLFIQIAGVALFTLLACVATKKRDV
jgi:hypothetical protein